MVRDETKRKMSGRQKRARVKKMEGEKEIKRQRETQREKATHRCEKMSKSLDYAYEQMFSAPCVGKPYQTKSSQSIVCKFEYELYAVTTLCGSFHLQFHCECDCEQSAVRLYDVFAKIDDIMYESK